jgi:hypothetical protein
MKQILFPLIVALIGFSCGQGERQSAPQRQAVSVQSAEPQTASALIAIAKENLAAAKAKLAQSGKYNCCMGDPCNHCALAESSCTCADDLKHGDAVCNECYGGWQEGKGDVPNIKKENVKADFMVHAEKK